MNRNKLLNILTENIIAITLDRPTLVAIDGRDAAGKTFLAKELAMKLRERGRTVIKASIDGFHNPRKTRYKRGRYSPEGYYRDSFDIESLKKYLLDPLKTGNMDYRTMVFDYRVNALVNSEIRKADGGTILVFDGVFTHLATLRPYWAYSIYLYIDEEESMRRAISRDQSDEMEIRRRYTVRYLPGQKIYHDESEPLKYASIIINNNDLENPIIL
ncbi:uridine kinase [Candidatus Bathyarchaeota archaeon]|nr:uridine kinase [Candidatus Bathyarchaeota archaeon]